MLSRNLQEQFAMLPETLGNHLTLCIVSLLLGMVISLPLAVIAVRRRRLQALLLGIASVIQTVPGLALRCVALPRDVGHSPRDKPWSAAQRRA